jgi:hypothetical protein
MRGFIPAPVSAADDEIFKWDDVEYSFAVLMRGFFIARHRNDGFAKAGRAIEGPAPSQKPGPGNRAFARNPHPAKPRK